MFNWADQVQLSADDLTRRSPSTPHSPSVVLLEWPSCMEMVVLVTRFSLGTPGLGQKDGASLASWGSCLQPVLQEYVTSLTQPVKHFCCGCRNWALTAVWAVLPTYLHLCKSLQSLILWQFIDEWLSGLPQSYTPHFRMIWGEKQQHLFASHLIKAKSFKLQRTARFTRPFASTPLSFLSSVAFRILLALPRDFISQVIF